MRSDEFWAWYDNDAAPKLEGRVHTFRKMFEHLDTFDRPVGIIETGCIERLNSWDQNGNSTVLFDKYAQTHPGSTVRSVDINPAHIKVAQGVVSDCVHLICGDSVSALTAWARDSKPVDLVYLDASHLNWGHPMPSQIHHYNELMAIMPALKAQSLVAVDDSPAVMEDLPYYEVGGKGKAVAQYAFEIGADLQFSQYQIGWTNMTAEPLSFVGGTLTGWTKASLDRIDELVLRARSYVEAAQHAPAARLYRLIMMLTSPPKTGVQRVAHGEACAFCARTALTYQKYGTAADWYRQALTADPLGTDYRLEAIIRAYMPMGAIKTALLEAERAVRISPDYGKAWHTLGGVQHELHNVKECAAAYQKGLELDPTDDDALLDAATIALDTADYDRVRELCARVSEKRQPDAVHCLAMVAYREGRHEDAIDLYNKALEGNCHDQPIVHWNRSIALHSIGRYREGFIDNEQREFQTSNAALSMPMRRFTKPRWKREPPPALIHVHTEAGYGDQICMLRYLKLIHDLGYKVRYESAESMVDLVARSFPEVEVIKRSVDYPGALGIRDFDYHSPIGSLAWIFETDVDTCPWYGPYLKPDPVLVEDYAKCLPIRQRKIGLCWSSGIREGIWMKQYGMNKSASFAVMHPFINLRDCFVSLQVGPERSENDSQRVVDLLPEKPDWDHTAALIENLDLVITVDTAVAHMAGAMGKPVWLMMHTAGSWHWLAERPGAFWNERSPWYPSVRIFRKKMGGDWSDVVNRILSELKEPSLIAAE